MIVLDTSVLVAYVDRSDQRHAAVAAWYDASVPVLATTPLVLAEIDHLLRTRTNAETVTAFEESLSRGAIRVEWWANALPATVSVARARPDVGLTDASLVALAAHLRTTSIATLDERHFRALTPLTGEGAFTLLPTDAV